MKPHAAILALLLCCGGRALAAEPGIVIDLTDVHLSLTPAGYGGELPIEPVTTWAVADWGLQAELRAGDRIESHAATQQHADYTPNLPAQVGVTLANSTAVASMSAMFGDIHLATALGPYPEEHVGIVGGGWNTQLNLPAHTELTMTGHVSIHTEGDPYNPFANFYSRFNSQDRTDVKVDLQRSDQAELDFSLTVSNPSDIEETWFHSTGLYATSVALASPVPEPPAAAMLAAGLLLGGWRLWRRAKKKGPQPFSM